MVEALIVLGIVFAAFVGVNIGGSSTGASFGPSVGASIVSKVIAGLLMTVFVLVVGWTIGRNIIHTLSEGLMPAPVLTLRAGVIVLFVIGLGLLIANLVGIPASTSETAVGAIVGLGLATGTLNRSLVRSIVVLWVVSPLVAMGFAAAIGRFVYTELEERLGVDISLSAPAIDLSWAGRYPGIEVNAEVTRRRGAVMGFTILIGCYMAFSAGANNVANAVAPLVGERALSTGEAVLLATAAIGVGAFTLARRTLETVGNDLAELQLTAALVVEVIAATVIATLSVLGVPRASRSPRRARSSASTGVVNDGASPGARPEPGRLPALLASVTRSLRALTEATPTGTDRRRMAARPNCSTPTPPAEQCSSGLRPRRSRRRRPS